MAPRELFSSRLTTVLTMVGVAVGLGNVWRFPYMMGSYGGSAFLFVYLGCVLLFALPALMGEWALGRATRRGPLGAFTAALGTKGRAIGIVLLLTVLIANSYYLVVVSNVAYTAAFSILHGFHNSSAIAAYQRGLDSGPLQATIGVAIIATAMVVLYLGLHRGIERISKLFVPFFGIVVLYLIVSSLSLPGAAVALRTFLRPDFSALTSTNVFAAMGQAFFSLSLGGTFYLIYGSYLRTDEPIRSSAAFTAMGDVGAALLAALFIVPATLALGLDLETGPRLIFVSLPELFSRIPLGRFSGTVFLIALGMMAYLSSIAAFQVLVGAGVDGFRWSIKRTLLVLGPLEAALMIPTALRPEFIGPLDLIFGSGMQVVGSGLALIALAWGLGKAATIAQVFGEDHGAQARIFVAWIRRVVPAVLLGVLTLYVLQR